MKKEPSVFDPENILVIDMFDKNILPDLNQPLVIFNSDFFKEDSLVVPKDLKSLIDCSMEDIQKCRLTADELSHLSLTQRQRSDFLKGRPLLIKAIFDKCRNKQKSGGQSYDKIEARVSMELKANTFLVVERLRLLLKKNKKRRHTSVGSARDQIILELARDWKLADTSAPDEKACLKIFNTRMEHGRKSDWELWFPNADMKSHLRSYLARFDKSTNLEIEQEIRFQKSLVLSLTKCQIRATRLRRTSNDIGKLLRNGQEEGPGARDSLAATTHEEYVAMDELYPAAFAGDFNPAILFPVHNYTDGLFDMMRIAGKYYRGYTQPHFTEEAIQWLIPAVALLERWESDPWDSNDCNKRGDTFLVHAMSRSMPLNEWKKILNI